MCQFFESAGLRLVAVITGCVGCLRDRGSSLNANIVFLNCTFRRACENQWEQLLLPSFHTLRSQEAELEGTSGDHLVYLYPKAGSATSDHFQTVIGFELEARNQEVLTLCLIFEMIIFFIG